MGPTMHRMDTRRHLASILRCATISMIAVRAGGACLAAQGVSPKAKKQPLV